MNTTAQSKKKQSNKAFPLALRSAEKRITRDLIAYANWFTIRFGIPDSTISRAAVSDPAYLASIRSGERALTLRKYDTLVMWFDAKSRTLMAQKRKQTAKAKNHTRKVA